MFSQHARRKFRFTKPCHTLSFCHKLDGLDGKAAVHPHVKPTLVVPYHSLSGAFLLR